MNGVEGERELLKKCAAFEEEAIQMFANLSYSNEVERAVQGTLKAHCKINDSKLVESLIDVCIANAYDPRLPRQGEDLRIRIRKYAIAFTKKWINQRLKGK